MADEQEQELGLLEKITGIDIMEGIAGGGIVSTMVYTIGAAVATLPSTFITPTVLPVLTVISGALTFAGILIHGANNK